MPDLSVPDLLVPLQVAYTLVSKLVIILQLFNFQVHYLRCCRLAGLVVRPRALVLGEGTP